MKLVDVHKANLNKLGFQSLEEWVSIPTNLYIGRNIPYVKGASSSKFRNKYSVKEYGLKKCLQLFYKEWKNKDISELKQYENIGCWCKNSSEAPKTLDECECHGEVLMMLLSNEK